MCVLPRRLQRYLIEVSIITVIVLLVVVMTKHWLGHSSHSSHDSNEESDFYHFYELPPHVVKYSDIEWKDLAKDGRRRTLNTSEGLVAVKDMMLVPKNPLPNGVNIYKSMESSLDSPSRGLDNFPERVVMHGVNRRKEAFLRPQNSNCSALPCTEFLSDQDILNFQQCGKVSMINEEPSATTCSFRQPNPSLRFVALASSPGSGVDLLRWFLQELTGLCTGSVECNTGLRRAGYAGESIRTTAVLGIAIDKVNPSWDDSPFLRESQEDADVPSFDSAVYLLRNPFDAILEVWNQQQENSELDWDSYVCEQALSWQQTLTSWLVDSRNLSVMVIRYEELESHTKKEMLKILKFLDASYSITKLVGVQWMDGKETVRGLDDFEAHHVECINTAIRKTAEKLSAHRHIDLLVYQRTTGS